MWIKKAVKHTLLGAPGNRVRTINSGLLKGLQFNVDTAFKSMRLFGFDEREIESDVRRLASRAVSALDIGANDGWYSVFFASLPNIKHVYAFEPGNNVIPSVQDNFAVNDPSFAKKLTYINKFVGDHTDDQFCSIDELLPDLTLPAIFKVDVDGGEMDVFRGAKKTLAKDGCVMVLETHSLDLENECQKFLVDLGYKTRIVNNGWYRAFIPETRKIEHNRWMMAARDL